MNIHADSLNFGHGFDISKNEPINGSVHVSREWAFGKARACPLKLIKHGETR